MIESRFGVSKSVGEQHEQKREAILEHITQQAEGIAGLINWYDQVRQEQDPTIILNSLDQAVTTALGKVSKESMEAFREVTNLSITTEVVEEIDDIYEDVGDESSIDRIMGLVEQYPDIHYIQRLVHFQEQMHKKVAIVAKLRNYPTAIRKALQRALGQETSAIKASDVKDITIEATGIHVALTAQKYSEVSPNTRTKDSNGLYLPGTVFSLIRDINSPEMRFRNALAGKPVDSTQRHEAVHNLIDDVGYAHYGVPQVLFERRLDDYQEIKKGNQSLIAQQGKERLLFNPNNYLATLHNEFLAELGAVRVRDFVASDQPWSTAQNDCQRCVGTMRTTADTYRATDAVLADKLTQLADQVEAGFTQLKLAVIRALRLAGATQHPADNDFIVGLAVVLRPEQYRHIDKVLRRKFGDSMVERELFEFDVMAQRSSLTAAQLLDVITKRLGRLPSVEQTQIIESTHWSQVLLPNKQPEGFFDRSNIHTLADLTTTLEQFRGVVPPVPQKAMAAGFFYTRVIQPLLHRQKPTCSPQEILAVQSWQTALVIASTYAKDQINGVTGLRQAIVAGRQNKRMTNEAKTNNPLAKFMQAAGVGDQFAAVLKDLT